MFRGLLERFTGEKSAMIHVRKIDAAYDVTGQLAPEQVGDVAARGYGTLICMRPDNEGFSQPAFSDMQAAARAAGIEAHYFPVVPGRMTPDQARKLKGILAGCQGPVLAYCASGNRCAAAYDMARRA